MPRISLYIEIGASLLFLCCSTANATFSVTGPIKGNTCSGFIIESCEMHRIDGVKGSDGEIYTMKFQYESVDEYNERTNLCWIKTKSKGAGWLSLGINSVAQPVFVEKIAANKYEELDVEYLVFPCAKK
jgi:hypothetical protein